MELTAIINTLDSLYDIGNWPPDPAMMFWVPKVYEPIDYDYEKVFETDFCERFNGLMLRSGTEVTHVFCASFATPDVMKKILDSGITDALLFLHHPVDMEVEGQGFLPIMPEIIREFANKRISIYACHAPLDCHDELGTNAAIVEALDMTVERGYIQYGLGYAGRIGTIKPVKTEALLQKIREIFEISRLELGGIPKDTISSIAVVAGGADAPEDYQEPCEAGCDLYLCGEWYPRYTPVEPDVREQVAQLKEETMAFAKTSNMLLVGASHSASEFLVMRTQLKDYFESKGLPTTPVPQDDWWR